MKSKENSKLLLATILSLIIHIALIKLVLAKNTPFFSSTNFEPAEISVNLTSENQTSNEQQIKQEHFYSEKKEHIIEPEKKSSTRTKKPPFDILPPHYFKTSQLSEKPNVIVDVDGSLAIFWKYKKPVVLHIYINEYGNVDDVAIENTDTTPEENKRIIDTFKKMLFSPGVINGTPVKCDLKIEVLLDMIENSSKR